MARRLMAVNIAFRLAYGIGGLLAPARMAALRLAPATGRQPEARLFVRGFSTHQMAVAVLGLCGRRWRGLERPAALAAAAIDLSDIVSAVVEADARGSLEQDLSGGIIFSAAGLATAVPALLGRRPD
jgi:hypothetical protein